MSERKRRQSILRLAPNMDETAQLLNEIPKNQKNLKRDRRVSFSSHKIVQPYHKDFIQFDQEAQSEMMHLSTSGSHEHLKGLSMLSNENKDPEDIYSELEISASEGLMKMREQDPNSSKINANDTAGVFSTLPDKNNRSVSNSTFNASDDNTMSIFQKAVPQASAYVNSQPQHNYSMFSDKTCILFDKGIPSRQVVSTMLNNFTVSNEVEDTSCLFSHQEPVVSTTPVEVNQFQMEDSIQHTQNLTTTLHQTVNDQSLFHLEASSLHQEPVVSMEQQSMEVSQFQLEELLQPTQNLTMTLGQPINDQSLLQMEASSLHQEQGRNGTSMPYESPCANSSVDSVNRTHVINQFDGGYVVKAFDGSMIEDEDTTLTKTKPLPDVSMELVSQPVLSFNLEATGENTERTLDFLADRTITQSPKAHSQLLENPSMSSSPVVDAHLAESTHRVMMGAEEDASVGELLSIDMTTQHIEVPEEVKEEQKPTESVLFTEPSFIKPAIISRPPVRINEVNETPRMQTKPFERARPSLVPANVPATPQNFFSIATPMTTPRQFAPPVPTFTSDNPYLEVPASLVRYTRSSVEPIFVPSEAASTSDFNLKVPNVNAGSLEGQTKLISHALLKHTNGDYDIAVNMAQQKYQEVIDEMKPKVDKLESLKDEYEKKVERMHHLTAVHQQLVQKALTQRKGYQEKINENRQQCQSLLQHYASLN